MTEQQTLPTTAVGEESAAEGGAITAEAERRGPSLWRSRNFLLLWSGQTVGELGSRISSVAVPLLATSTLHASVFQVSLLTFLAWLPYLLISLPAGIIADRVDQRKLMIACDLGRMVLMASLPIVALGWELHLWYLYAVVGLSGVLTVLFKVSYQAQLPRLVDEDQLVDGNAKLVMSQDFAEFIGPSISGVLIGLIGATKTFFTNSAAFLVSALTLSLMRPAPGRAEKPAKAKERTSVRTEMTEGLGFIRSQPILRRILACTTTSTSS